MKLVSKFVLILSAIVLTACAASNAPKPTSSADASMQTKESATAPQVEDYRINVGDKIELTVFDDERLNNTYLVSTNGTVSLPLIGSVVAGNNTIEEFITAVEEKLKNELINKPRVSAQIVGFRPFYVLGEVERPGSYDYNFDMTIYGAIAASGGFSFRAKQDVVYIRRAGSDLEEVLEITPSLKILPGDTIRIGARNF